jgi:hypothetical protein
MNKEQQSVTHRIATWAAIIPMGLYVMNMGQWVGAADEKFEDAETVEQEVDDIKERITKLETEVKNLDKNSADRALALMKAIEKLETKLDND